MADVRAELYNDSVEIPTYVDARVLGASTAETFTVPAGYYFAVFSGNVAVGDYYTKIGGTAAVPAADISDGSASFPNIGYCRVTPGQVISVISPTAGIITIAFYPAP